MKTAPPPYGFTAYMERLVQANRLARREGFRSAVCSGVGHLEGLLEAWHDTERFVCTSDVCEGAALQRGGGWFMRRVFTVFVLARFDWGDSASQEAAMGLCRELYRQLLSRLLRDAEDAPPGLAYLNMADVRSTEIGGAFVNGCTGLYFMLAMDEPTDISYNPAEWNSP